MMVRSGYRLWELWESGGLTPSELTDRDWSLLVQFLHQRGWSLSQIAESLGLSERSVRDYLGAHRGGSDWVSDLYAEREKDIARLERLYSVWSERALEDVKAADLVRRLLELRMKLLGLDRVAGTEDPSVAVWREASGGLRVVDGSAVSDISDAGVVSGGEG